MAENHIKYPRTPHLPWSQGQSRDDQVLSTTQHFEGKEVIVTEKMDGENTTMYHDHIHARSTTSSPHPSRDWVKKLWSQIQFNIPKGLRVCGENVFAKHSIHYRALPSYFLVFAIFEENVCLSWKETECIR
ncbi:MAG: RNA ligase family protein [Candidatus Latescibacteria bacterium]|jgi:hypothetical protein|nr:RNA ligase family protein [Candidatus Latescibacterota bacterium]MBT5832917.1 RNA ligase family protein [Candidatus Latescibacterota bacterium]